MSSSRDKKTLAKAILAGMLVTKILYFIPVVHLFGPIFGGATTAYIINRGPWGGLKSGLIKGLAMTFPAIILAVFFAPILADIPLIGNLLAGSVVLVVGIVVIHSVTLGMAGGFVSGFIAQKARSSSPVETTAKTTATAANTAAKTTAAASNTVDSAKGTYSEHREVDEEEEQTGEDSPTDAGDGGTGAGGAGSTDSPSGMTTDSAESTQGDSVGEGSGGNGGDPVGAGAPTGGGTGRHDVTEVRDVADSPCVACGASVPSDVQFCPECGAEDPFTDDATSESGRSPCGSEGARDASSTTGGRGGARHDGRESAGHPASAAADAVAARERPNSDVADRLCQVLSDPDMDRNHIESALGDAVERLETDATLADAVSRVDNSPTPRQLESARSRVSRTGGDIAAGLLPVFDRAIELAEERDRSETERDRHREAAERLCRAADGVADLGSGDVADRATALADAIDRGEVSVERPSSSLSALADRVRAAVRPQSPDTRQLLDALDDGDEGEAAERLRSTVERVDELSEVQAAIADIEVSDVRRRIESLERELQRADGSVYRHLADRVRELEAMADDPDIDDVQLYAVYQECTFYDRTLVPRLSRSDGSAESVDVARRVRDIEDRIAAINDEYVSVRADHNHTIPTHFLDLAETLCDRARRTGDERPQQAAGQLAAASDLLDGVEDLYERNEYSVMLRRLRG